MDFIHQQYISIFSDEKNSNSTLDARHPVIFLDMMIRVLNHTFETHDWCLTQQMANLSTFINLPKYKM